ncbi:alpha/beta fold hydrolase [Oceanicaulis alexandrii]|uniref:alpha/beta hydrolase n=1 Tax=Oceanicaulis alexandrii TaxID=153233 RepID=UPI0035CEE0DD
MSFIQTTRFNRRTLLGGAAAALSLPVSSLFTPSRAAAQTQGATEMEKVTFLVDQTPLVGDLYGAQPGARRPAVAIIGPMTYQKEQAPTEYAKRLAGQGFVTLAYDSRYRGESGGEPRAWENPFHKVEDLKAAVAYLKSRPDVDPDQVSILAICQGSSVAFRAAAEIEGVHALATIAGHYRDAEGDVEWLTEDGLAARRAQGEAAKAKFAATGEVEYIKGVDQTDMNVGMPGEFVWVWYQPWADRGQWDNRYAVMSDADLLNYESISAAETLTAPWLMIHGDNCFLPNAAHRHMAAVPETTRTKTIWDETPHLAYYDQSDAIDRATAEVVDWIRNA